MAPADPELRELIKEMNRSALAEQFRNRKTNQTNSSHAKAFNSTGLDSVTPPTP